MRRIVGLVVAATCVAAGLGLVSGAPASAELPVVVPIDVGGFPFRALGANAAGDVYYRAEDGDHVRRANGTVVNLGDLPSDLTGEVGFDGRLWLVGDGVLLAIAPDGTRTEIPVDGGEVTPVEVTALRAAPDHHIWFIDSARHAVGRMADDGTGATDFVRPGTSPMGHLAIGPDGRAWVGRGLVVDAIAPDGSATSISVGAPVTGIAATSQAVWVVANNRLLRIDPGNVATLVRSNVGALQEVASAGGYAWFSTPDGFFYDTTFLVISPSGRIATFAEQDEFSNFDPGREPTLQLAVDRGGAFVGVVDHKLVRIPSPAIDRVHTASARIVTVAGTNMIRVTATSRTPGGRPLSETLDVVLLGAMIGDSNVYDVFEQQSTTVGQVKVVNGTGTVDIPVVSSLEVAARPPGLLHMFCCDITVQSHTSSTSALRSLPSKRSGISGGPSDSYYGPVVTSSTSRYMETMSRDAIGHTMDTPGIVYWGSVLAGGAPRATPARSIVASSSWRRYRATLLYQRWLGRRPTSSEQDYWADRLIHDTTSAVDLAMAAKPVARDAGGTTNAQRGAHLAAALHIPASYGKNYAAKLGAGARWTTVVHDAYWSSAALTQRINDMGARSTFTPSLSTLGSRLRASGDEREVEIVVLATLPNQSYGAYS